MTTNALMAAIASLGDALLARDEAIQHWQQRALAAEAKLAEPSPNGAPRSSETTMAANAGDLA